MRDLIIADLKRVPEEKGFMAESVAKLRESSNQIRKRSIVSGERFEYFNNKSS